MKVMTNRHKEQLQMLQTLKTVPSRQVQLYRLIHPDFEGLTLEEAANRLGIGLRAVQQLKRRMKNLFPEAFRYEEQFVAIMKEKKVRSFESIVKGFKGNVKVWSKYTGHEIPYELTDDELYSLITLPCCICNHEPYRSGVTKEGNIFRYNYLRLGDYEKGYTYLNCYPLCWGCLKGGESDKFGRGKQRKPWYVRAKELGILNE